MNFSGNVRFTRDWGYFQAAGMIRRIKWVDTINDEFALDGTEVGAGVNLTSTVKFTPNAYRRGHYGLGNLLFYPYENVMVGGEFSGDGGKTFWMVSSPTTYASSFPIRIVSSSVQTKSHRQSRKNICGSTTSTNRCGSC